MCGIAGLTRFDGAEVDAATLRRMTHAIAHRGPDGEGIWCDGPVGLGHRRLAIVDLSAAAQQPMVSGDGNLVLIYNGEIYNYQSIKAELETLGHAFRSRSDSEVVMYALKEWGAEALVRFNGMFALALWNRRERTMLLARDRYGIKPLYYTLQSDYIAFASEQKALLEIPGATRVVDREALLEYFTFQNFFTDKTLIRGIRTLPAGYYAVVRPFQNNSRLAITQYWDFAFEEPTHPSSTAEYEEELDRLFNQAIRRQLIGDVEIGCYLSGGMDSGSIAGISSRILSDMKTFTCGFDLSSASGLELAFDERANAEHMSYCFKTEQYEMVLKAGDMERSLPSIVHHLEEPRVGQSYPNYYAAKLASRFVKVVLSGAGGDELFGGYPWRYYRATVNDDFEHYIDKYYLFWQRLIPNTTIKEVFSPIRKDIEHIWTRDIFRDVFKRHANELNRPADYINHSLYFEAKTFLHGLLTVEDKLSMAHSLENRVPFLDNDLVDFAMRCPVNLKLQMSLNVERINENEAGDKASSYFRRTNDGKKILRRIMQKYLPRRILEGKKQGFSGPDASWFKGESIEFVRNTIVKGKPLIFEFLNRNSILKLVEEHMSGTTNRRLLIWSLIYFEAWLRQYKLQA
jgi:asparagine synthase (glutamine-hydrolysing)